MMTLSLKMVDVTVTVTVMDNLFGHELQKSPALPSQCADYYADPIEELCMQ
jgi:hypothetical protein